MRLAELYRVDRVPKAYARELVSANHYLRKPGPTEEAYGLIRLSDNVIVGVVTYGTPSSAPLRSGICGPDYADKVTELSRLWIDDEVQKNAASYLVSRSLKTVRKPIVVSFADTAQGHTGTIYQAANFLYTGLSADRTSWTVKGQGKHGQTLADKYTSEEIRALYGDDFSLVRRSRKHRYIYIAAKGQTKRMILQALRYPVQPYP